MDMEFGKGLTNRKKANNSSNIMTLTLESGDMVKLMDMECILGVMGINTRENGELV